MEPSGIRRKVDDLGRVVLPVGMRRALGIGDGAVVEVRLDGDRVVIAKPAEHCAFCEGTETLREFRGKVVCWSCLAALRALSRDREREPGGAAPSDGAAGGAGPGASTIDGEESLLGTDPS